MIEKKKSNTCIPKSGLFHCFFAKYQHVKAGLCLNLMDDYFSYKYASILYQASHEDDALAKKLKETS